MVCELLSFVTYFAMKCFKHEPRWKIWKSKLKVCRLMTIKFFKTSIGLHEKCVTCNSSFIRYITFPGKMS